MKRLLSLLLVIAMLFGVCTVFTACDDSSGVSDEEEESGSKKKKDVLDTFMGLKVDLPKSFEKEDSGDDYAVYSNGDYEVFVSYEVNYDEVDTKDIQEQYEEELEYALEEGYLTDGKSGKTDKKTRYVYGISEEESSAIVITFYTTDKSVWLVEITNTEDNEDYDVQQMIKYVTDWDYSDPKIENDEDDEGNGDNEGEDQPTAEPQRPTTEASVPGNEGNTEQGDDADGYVVWNSAGVTIRFIDLAYSYNEIGCELLITNNSGYDIEVYGNNLILNSNAYIDDGFFANVEDGTEIYTYITFSADVLDRYGIEQIGNVEFHLYITDIDSYEYLLEDYPVSFETVYGSIVSPMDTYGVTLMEEEGIRVILQELNLLDEYNSNMWLYIENNNDVPISMDLERPTFNNWTIAGIYGNAYVPPHAYTIIPVDVYDLVEFGLSEESAIHSMRLPMTFYDASGYYGQEICTVSAYYCPGYPDYVQDTPAESIVLYDGYAFTLQLYKIESYYSNAVVRLLMSNYQDDIPVYVRIENVCINGQPVSDELYEALDVEAHCLADLWLSSNDEIGFYGVEDLQSLSFTLIVLDHTHYPIFEEVIEVPIN